jgi:hypothetical protein
MYSNACRAVKYKPRMIVIAKPFNVCEWLFSISLWWAQVTEIPEDRRIIVFNRGIWKGLKGAMFFGGQDIPISIAGASLE